MLNTTLEQKSALARLLATENLRVNYSPNYPTAFFDLKSRTIHIPLIGGIDEDLLDLFEGHEVGHAIDTPEEGFHSAIKENEQYGNAFKTYLNVVEDVRIERKMKVRYPGIKRPWINAYNKLVDLNFFGEQIAERINGMEFIDRLNIFAKIGSRVYVEFDSEEKALVDEAFTLETWEDVVAYANKIFNRQSEENKKQAANPQPDQNGVKGESKEKGESSEGVSSEDSDQDQNQETEGASTDGDSEEGKEPGSDTESDETSNKGDASGVKASETDETFRRKEQEMYDKAKKKAELNKYNQPGRIEFSNTPYDMFLLEANYYTRVLDIGLRFLHDKVADQKPSGYNESLMREASYDAITAQFLNEHRKQNAAYTNFLIKEFEMRKNARILNRGKISKSGKVDINRIHKYKISNDVFARITSFPEGKNHGMCMYIDLSGSMADTIGGVINQALILSDFCKKVGIPFRVFGFSNDDKACKILCERTKVTHEERFHIINKFGGFKFHNNYVLKEYISSELRPADYKIAFNNLLMLKAIHEAHESRLYPRYAYDGKYSEISDQLRQYSLQDIGEGLSATPLNDCILTSIQITNDFVSKYKIENMINIFLSDGEDDHRNSFLYNTDTIWNSSIDRSSQTKVGASILSGYGVRYLTKFMPGASWSTSNLLQFARRATGARYVGFFILKYAGAVMNNIAYSSGDYHSNINNIKSKFRRDGFITSGNFGYDVQFFISSKQTIMNDYDEEDNDKWWEEVQKKAANKGKSDITTKSIAKGFTDQQTKKQLNRIMLVEFTKAIAEAA
jgi:hypothetical protein